jgi:two-component system, NarL family, sensor kinase
MTRRRIRATPPTTTPPTTGPTATTPGPAPGTTATTPGTARTTGQSTPPARRTTAGERVQRWAASAVVQFAVSGLVALAVVGLLAVHLVQRSARDEALRDAKDLTRIAGQGIVAPALTPGVLRGDPAALNRLDDVVRRDVLRPPVVRVKLWTPGGRILYSDEPRLIGEHYRLGDEELEALRGGVDAEISDLSKPENRFERSDHRLREVYLGITGPRGRRLLFEEYLRDSSIAAGGQRVWRDIAPVLLGALVLLYLVQIPLAGSLTRRLRRGQHEREALLHQAIDASEHERRRIARELHDGVVQDLAGVSYGLSAAAAGPDGPGAGPVSAAADEVRRAIRQLRTLLLDLYPERLHRQGLEGALSDLLARLHARSLTTELSIEPGLELPAAQEALLFRAAQEALRNVTDHARATHVGVEVSRSDGKVTLAVADDGQGIAPADDERPRLGLRMLEDLAEASGGSLEITSAPGSGTTLRLRLPVRA